MRFLTDQDVYAITIRFLSGLGHDVVTAAQLGLAQAEDLELLRVAQDQGRIFVTRDRDFGGLVFALGSGGEVIYLRMPSTLNVVHAELGRILTLYDEQELRFVCMSSSPGGFESEGMRQTRDFKCPDSQTLRLTPAVSSHGREIGFCGPETGFEACTAIIELMDFGFCLESPALWMASGASRDDLG